MCPLTKIMVYYGSFVVLDGFSSSLLSSLSNMSCFHKPLSFDCFESRREIENTVLFKYNRIIVF